MRRKQWSGHAGHQRGRFGFDANRAGELHRHSHCKRRRRTAKLAQPRPITDEVPQGIVSMDHGWGSRLFDPKGGEQPEVKGVNRNQLVSADILDELTGTPNLNGTNVNVRLGA